MGKIVKQYRYYGEVYDEEKEKYTANPLNWPTGLLSSQLETGQVFVLESDISAPIVGLGIQTIPGIKFHLNGDAGDPIVVGASGIYELELQNNFEIDMLQFERKSLNELVNTMSNNAYLIVDAIYETGE